MKAKFELKTWLSENREVIIAKYNALTNEQYFNGITLKEFMVAVMQMMINNNIKSDKRAAQMLPFLMGNVYMNNSNVYAQDKVTERLASQHQGTAFMAMV